ncbi:trichohyalin [Drosophila tropicalis]|uniref:trichohyalin n=1 Tax=Drosophila tropicalis TaxID=46794 RepID=UPI0035ABD11E
MNTSMNLAKTMNKCAQVLRQRSSQLIGSHGRAWSTMGKPRSSTTFTPSNFNLKSTSKLTVNESSLALDQRRFYNDRNDWTEVKQRESQPGMAATYDMPKSGPATTRYDEIYLNRGTAPRYEESVQYDDGESQQHQYAQMGQHDGESRRRMTQDPVEHQLRQERIIEENRRMWQNRAETNREVHVQGINYNIDNVFGAEMAKLKSSRVVKNKQTDKEFSRNRRAALQNELRRNGYNLEDGESEHTKDQVQNDNDFNKPSKAWLNKQTKEEDAKHWHTWTSCPDERSLVKKAHQASQDRKFQQSRSLQPYDVTRRGLHHHQASNEDSEDSDEQLNNLKAHAKARVKTPEQVKSEYLLSLMQQDEDKRREQEDSDSDEDDDEEVEICPPARRRTIPATTLAYQPIAARHEAQPVQQEQQDNLFMSQARWRQPMRRNRSLRIPVYKMKQDQPSRSISPPRFQMSVRAKVPRTPAPVCCFSDTVISRMSVKSNNNTQYRDSVRPSISATWNDFTSSHFSKAYSN